MVPKLHQCCLSIISIIATDCTDGNIRLAEGATALEGRVEMCYREVWGTVCSNEWGPADAAVTCRELGYSSSG